MTGETQNNPSDFSHVDLYGGPLDGEEFLLPRAVADQTAQLEIIRPCNRLILEKLNYTPVEGKYPACAHLYIRYNSLSLRFRFHSTSLV